MPERTQPAGVSKFKQTIGALFDIRPGDGLPLLVLLSHSFLKGAARVLLDTPANTLFLSRFSITKLPLVYVATAIVCVIIGLVYARLEARISIKTLLTGTLGFLSVITLAFYLGLSATNSRSLVFGLMVWKDVHWTLMNIEFWALAAMLLDVRQGKRLFGMIALGEIVAGTLGGFSVPLFMRTGGTLALLFLSAAVTVLNVLLLFDTLRRFTAQGEVPHEEKSEDRKSWLSLFKDHYLALFFGVSMLSFFAEYFIDYLFYQNVEVAFSNELKLASFFGLFYGVLGMGQLISSAWVSGRCLTRYGLSFGLLALPVAAFATTGVASIGEMLRSAAALLFWAIVSAKFCDEIIRHTVEMPSYRILYQPLPPHQRMRVQTVRESIVEPMSIGLVGLFLWGAQSLFALKPVHILYLTVIVALGWGVMCFLLRREYTRRLTRALTARRLGGGSFSLEDQSSISVLEQVFQGANAGQVIYCLNMIHESPHPFLETNLLKLLDHADPLVRAHVLGKIERLALRHALDPIRQRLPSEKSPEVRAAMLRTICALGEADMLEPIIPFLKDPDTTVRRGALVGLLRHCGIDGVLSGGSHLSGLLISLESSERQLAAEVLGDIGIPSFYRPLLALLRDKDTAVCATAIEAARKLRVPGTVPPLLEALTIPALRAAASCAIAEIGAAALVHLETAFNAPGRSRTFRKSIASICGRIGDEKAAAFLSKLLSDPNLDIRTQIIAALVRCHEKCGRLEALETRALIRREVEEASWALAAWADLEDRAAPCELSRALLGEIEERRQRILLLLCLIYPIAVIRKVRLDLEISTGEKKAHALEVLDNLLSRELKQMTFPLIDTLPTPERVKQLHALFPQSRLGRSARLGEILKSSSARISAWTRACAFYVAGKSQAAQWSPLARAASLDPDSVVRETALWTLWRVDTPAFQEFAASRRHEPEPGTTVFFRQLLNQENIDAPHH